MCQYRILMICYWLSPKIQTHKKTEKFLGIPSFFQLFSIIRSYFWASGSLGSFFISAKKILVCTNILGHIFGWRKIPPWEWEHAPCSNRPQPTDAACVSGLNACSSNCLVFFKQPALYWTPSELSPPVRNTWKPQVFHEKKPDNKLQGYQVYIKA